jgi:hypothetical protein
MKQSDLFRQNADNCAHLAECAAASEPLHRPLMSLIGFRLLKHSKIALHYGASDIAFSLETPIDGLPAMAGNGVHVAFHTPDRETVRRFHEYALANGSR